MTPGTAAGPADPVPRADVEASAPEPAGDADVAGRLDAEWLEADGLGGFASGTVAGPRTRRYHALLLAATTPPAGRVVLVNGIEARVDTPGGSVPLSTQIYAPDVRHPRGDLTVESFEASPWPAWTHRLPGGARLRFELLVTPGRPAVTLRWTVSGDAGPITLYVRPLLSGRDPHALHRHNDAFRFAAQEAGESITWHPYEGLPAVRAVSNGRYRHAPDWYRNFLYVEERHRGLDHIEDLASPGEFSWALDAGDAVLVLEADTAGAAGVAPDRPVAAGVAEQVRLEADRRLGRDDLERAADAYVVRRGRGLTIVAGYPWFGDWGRDTFIALRGLALATGRIEDAAGILVEWAAAVSEGMMPNRFPDQGDTPEYNSVDASLWYVVAVRELLEAHGSRLARRDRDILRGAVAAILEGYSRGTRHGIRMDDDGLLACGETGVQLTWMDAKVGDWVVTPRIGKPVEVQALWLNALAAGAWMEGSWAAPLARGRTAFEARFWNGEHGRLHDVVDVNHVPGTIDASCRPNQVFAVGGLPMPLLEGARARAIVDDIERNLWTPLGLRSLAADEPGYVGRYGGGVLERDGAYHQGTVWPWLIGPFVEAWVRVRGDTPRVKAEARRRFLAPLEAHRRESGLGHISEIADGDPPHTPRGCPFQAWSVGEMLRLDRIVLR